jgi:hypothetical protein
MPARRRGIATDVAPADQRVCADRDDHGIAARHPFFDVTPRLVERRRFESGKKPAFARHGVKRAAKGGNVSEPDRRDFKADAIALHAATKPVESAARRTERAATPTQTVI